MMHSFIETYKVYPQNMSKWRKNKNNYLESFLYLGLYRGSYIRAHVVLNLLNKVWKSNKICEACQAMASILSLFPKEFNKFNNTGAGMLDSIYQMIMTFKNFCYCVFGVKILTFCQIYAMLCQRHFRMLSKSINP